MKKEKKIITERGNYAFEDNYNIICEWYCNITCGNNCLITCVITCVITCGNNCKVEGCSSCNIICGNDCIIECGWDCNITCGNDCKINCMCRCYIKAGDGSQLKLYHKLKTISNDEQFIWWYVDENYKFINTYEDDDWKNKNFDKFKELYPFLHDELDSTTLF